MRNELGCESQVAISDGFASIVGQKLGKEKYTLWRGQKSYIGSLTFFVTALILGIAVSYGTGLLALVIIGLLLTLIEACLSEGLDNLVLTPVGSGLLMLAMKLI